RGRGGGIELAGALDELRAGDVAVDARQHLEQDPALAGPAEAARPQLAGHRGPAGPRGGRTPRAHRRLTRLTRLTTRRRSRTRARAGWHRARAGRSRR